MMSAKPKKIIIMNILDILRRYSDEGHRLSQKDISDILAMEYDTTVDRKTVKRNIETLMEYGYEINFSESTRMMPSRNGGAEESTIMSDFYLERDFSDSELRLLIDSLLYSKHIPHNQCRELAKKLEGLSSKYFKSRMRHINVLPDHSLDNKQLFYTIEILDEAIAESKQVSFNYNSFRTDKKLYPRVDDGGNVKEYIVNPYQIASNNGRYYLICSPDGSSEIYNYRLDRISNIRLLESKSDIGEQMNEFDVYKHIQEHPYMFSGKTTAVVFRAKKYLLNDLFDWFGKEITFLEESEDEVTAKIVVSENAMRRWALQYALHTRVLSPKYLAEQIKEDLENALKNYESELV